jgi:hypothetical protein
MKNDTILFRLVWSDRILTKKEKDELLEKDPGAGIFLHPIDASPKYFEYDGSDELYSLEQIRSVIRNNPSAIWTVHETKCRRKGFPYDSEHQLGEMDGKTALLKFG